MDLRKAVHLTKVMENAPQAPYTTIKEEVPLCTPWPPDSHTMCTKPKKYVSCDELYEDSSFAGFLPSEVCVDEVREHLSNRY